MRGSIKFSSTSFPNRLLKNAPTDISSSIFIGGITKSSPALSLPIGEISLVFKNGLISVGMPIIEPPGIGYNLFLAKMYD